MTCCKKKETPYSEEEKLEDKLFGLFILLNESEPGILVNRAQVQPVLTFMKGGEGKEADIEEAFNQNSSLNHLNFSAFTKFMKEIEMAESAEKIEENIYKSYFKRNYCTRCIACCCIGKCRKKRHENI